MPSITVPKPVTSPSPVTVTHTPYDPTGMLFPKSSSISSGPAKPLGTITSVFQNPAAPPATTTPAATAPSNRPFTPVNPALYQTYMDLLNHGYTVSPTTGQAAVGYRGFGAAGPTGYRGTLDPNAAKAAIQAFQQGGGIATYGPGGYVRPGYNANTGQPIASTPATATPAPSAPPTGSGMIDPSGYNSPNAMVARAIATIQQAQNPILAAQGTPQGSQELINNAMRSLIGDITSQAANVAKGGGGIASPVTPTPAAPTAAVGPVTYYNPSANLPGYDPNARITPGWKPQPKK